MTRRSKRFEKRRAKREARRVEFYKRYDDFNVLCNRQNLYNASNLAKRHVMWKGTVQRWSINQLINTEKLYRDLQAGKDVRKGFSKFVVCERGKKRNISAVKFYERVVQKCLCQNILYSLYTKSLLFDNAASQTGKGTKFANDRMVTALRRHYKKYGTEGYALLVDFKGYFENINHDVLKMKYRKYFKDKKLLAYIDSFVDAYGALGLGLGSETSQMHAIFYPNEIDHAITEKCKGVSYGRYMDDSYIIARDKSTIVRALSILKQWCDNLKIILSPKKTMIVKIKSGLKWLKTKFFLAVGGKVIKKPCRKSVVIERRKLKKQLRLVASGGLKISELTQSLESWAGSMKRRNARLTVWKMRQLLWRK